MNRPAPDTGETAFAIALVMLAVLSASIAWLLHVEAKEMVVGTRLLRTPKLAMPAYLEAAVDPTFRTEFVRVTDPGQKLKNGMACAAGYCRHRYSSTQAWNADQSLLLISKGCKDLCFLDGRTYEPLFLRKVSRYQDCKWLPQTPETMVCVHPAAIVFWAPRANTWNLVYRPKHYKALEFGPYKGNPSRKGNLIVVRARNAQKELVAFAFDLVSGKKYPDIKLSALTGTNRYVSISPSGRYIYVAQHTPDDKEPSYVFTVDGALVQHWPEHHRPGHGDMTIDADGEDVYVGVSKSDPDKFHVIKRRLRDGKVVVLHPYGDSSHVSARNTGWPGWVFVTYQGSYAHTAAMQYPARFYSEIVAVRIDGSGETLRLAHTRAVKHNYISEIHGSPSPDGSQVIWASNWGKAGRPVSAYVTKLPAHGQPLRRQPRM